MPKIPLMIPPESGELMISYLWRLALHNGFSHITDFLYAYFCPNKELKEYQNRQYVRLDSNNTFQSFFQASDLSIDFTDFYLDHTLYKGLAPLIHEGRQIQIIAHAFHNSSGKDDLIGIPTKQFAELRICPYCQDDDIRKKGFWYYHCVHHMPGVAMCAKHQVSLHALKMRNSIIKQPFCSSNVFVPKEETSTEWALKYASFAASLLETKVDADVSLTHRAILNALKERDLYYDTNSLLRHFHEEGCNTLTDEQAIKSIKTTMHGGNTTSVIQTLSFLTLCFPTARDLQNAINTVYKNTDELDKFISIVNQHYNIVGDFYKPLLEMVRIETYEHFLTTFKGFLYGWREKRSDVQKSSEVILQDMFQNSTDGLYHLASPYQDARKKITVLHDICGRKYQVFVRDFLLFGKRCPCERSYSPKKAKAIVEQHKEFKLIEYPIGKYKPCTIFHEYCGSTFKATLPAFFKNPKCTRCAMSIDYSVENIEQLINDLVGDEYTLIGSEGKTAENVIIKHNVCNKTHTFISKSFTTGSRCPYCNNNVREDSFRRYVAEVSGNRYKIGRNLNRKSRYEIIDTYTDEVRIFSRNRIMQELRRPTPSPVLPLDKKYSSNALKTHKDIIWDYLITHYGPDGFICSNDIPIIDEIPKERISAELYLLCNRRKKLFYAYKGHTCIYAFKSTSLTSDEIIEILYIKRNGIRYGCIHSKSLAYEIGILSEKPKTTNIMSNIYYQKKSRHFTTKDFDIILSGHPILITEDNYKILQFIDLCRAAKIYSWNNARDKIAEFAENNKVSVSILKHYLPHYDLGVQSLVKQMIEKIYLCL